MSEKKTEKPEKRVHVVNMSNYNSPVIKENLSKDYVTYGKKHDYFQYLIDRRRGSATNGAVISSIIDMIYGKGLTASNKAMKPDEYAQLLSIFKPEDNKKVLDDLYSLGQGAYQIQYKGGHKKVMSAVHVPIETLAPAKVDDKGKINSFFYHRDWKNKKSDDELKEIPAFGTSTKGIEILYIKPYKSGLFYYASVDYQGSLQYSELEEEIGNYHINNIKNGLAPSMMINFNNGIPPDEKQDEIVKRITQKYKGTSNTGKLIVGFNDRSEDAATIEAVQLSDAADQYQFLSDECQKKIFVGHRVTSPLLFGVSTNVGFGSNADELKVASLLFEALVAKPKRQLFIENISQVLAFNKISLDLEFESLNPFETPEEVAMNNVKLQSHDVELEAILESYALDPPEGYEFYGTGHDVSAENEKVMHSFASTANSEQDTKLWKIRYAYSVGTSQNPKGGSRVFCNKMMALSFAGKVFRKEDIMKMSEDGVNGNFAHSGGKYDIFKFAGGVNCYHRWERRIFKKKRDDNDKPLGGNALQNTFPVNVNEARRQGAKIPKNDKDVAIAEIDKPNNGRYDG